MVGTVAGIGGSGLTPLGGGAGSSTTIIDPITGLPANVTGGALKVQDNYVNPIGVGTAALSDYDGALILQSGNVLKAMLVEMRVFTNLMQQLILDNTDPQQYRNDEIQLISDDALNAAA